MIQAIHLDPRVKNRAMIGRGTGDKRAHKNEIRNGHLELEENGDGELFLQSHVREIFRHRDLTPQIHDSLVNASDPDGPSLKSRRREKLVPETAQWHLWKKEKGETHGGNHHK